MKCFGHVRRSFKIVKVVFHVLYLLLVLAQILFQTLVFLGKRLIVGRMWGLVGRRIWRQRRLLYAFTHSLIVVNMLLKTYAQ